MSGESFLQSKDIWNHPMISDRGNNNGYEVSDLLEEYAKIKVKAKLEEAAERAKTKRLDQTRFLPGSGEPYNTIDWVVDKQSITETPLD